MSLGPECTPFATLDSVWKWKEKKHKHEIATVPLACRGQVRHKEKTLICHDLKGGYLEDRLTQGSKCGDAYRFYHWQYVDTFTYFSHKLVTIPPPCWTNAAHRHGVKVLGTVITEWEDGAAICRELLESRSVYRKFADALVAMAQFYNFDGWLINIENKIEASHIEGLRHFVQYLSKTMHERRPGSEVIWYDSVTVKGDLDWQNELNANNSIFFDACDGIFLNYTWKPENLVASAEHAILKSRKNDVYVGVDVFGRNCPGGGGYNTIEALSAARQYGLSVAIFAPAWAYETLGHESFTANENKYWELLHSRLTCYCPISLPLVTSFCQGQGKSFYLNGKVVSSDPWTDLSIQSSQPNMTNSQFVATMSTAGHMTYTPDEAWCGGGCLKITGRLTSALANMQYRLFSTNISLDTTKKLHISYTFKANSENIDVALEAHFLVGTDRKIFVLQDCKKSIKLSEKSEVENKIDKEDIKKNSSDDAENNEKKDGLEKTESAPEPDKQHEDDSSNGEDVKKRKIARAAVEYVGCDSCSEENGWKTRVFNLAFSADFSSTLTLVSVRCGRIETTEAVQPDFTLHVGHLKLEPTPSGDEEPCSASNVQCQSTQIQEDTTPVHAQLITFLKWRNKGHAPFCYNIYYKQLKKKKVPTATLR